ncbi:hypothetical protein AC482_06180 [miscellaneous Crenarchaeota group-15 archaeon DG-45]|uniref:Transcription regulator TrmB N-terminal domain-containing protein n=1 Tax=miscellaneous Crenarchaeota group-15 archaeon DG-45 TaxID=1685127 RepID=A0A0M0BLZ0_9ARCH|nr:MAG: hypothetical protein AC482_06180 [miscellaneous Crenarchaeota group-15 archaeon DG-45]
MQVRQLKRLEAEDAKAKESRMQEENLDLLLVYSRASGRNRVTEEEAEHLRALRLIKRSLNNFDLSKNEVRVYLFLARFGAQKAQRIAEALGIHRTEAYKILRRLERQGLVSCVFERPMKFIAAPFDKGLESLIEEKRHLIDQLERRKKELLDIWFSLPKADKVRTPSETLQVLEGRRQISVKANELVNGCEREILMAVADKSLLWLYNSPFFDDLEKTAKKRRLDIRVLTNYSPTSAYVLEQVNLDEGDFAYLEEEAPGFIMTDGGQMILLMERGQGGGGKPFAMWTNYGSIVKSFRLLFTLLWKKELSASILQLAGAEPVA